MRVDVSPECYWLLGVSITPAGLVRLISKRGTCANTFPSLICYVTTYSIILKAKWPLKSIFMYRPMRNDNDASQHWSLK